MPGPCGIGPSPRVQTQADIEVAKGRVNLVSLQEAESTILSDYDGFGSRWKGVQSLGVTTVDVSSVYTNGSKMSYKSIAR